MVDDDGATLVYAESIDWTMENDSTASVGVPSDQVIVSFWQTVPSGSRQREEMEEEKGVSSTSVDEERGSRLWTGHSIPATVPMSVQTPSSSHIWKVDVEVHLSVAERFPNGRARQR